MLKQESEIVEMVEDVIKRGVAAIGAVFTDEGDDWYPQAFFGAPDGIDIANLPLDAFKDAESKNRLADALAGLAEVSHARVVGLLLSCWIASLPPNTAVHPNFSASEAPNRREVLQLVVYTADKTLLQQAYIVRHAGKPPTLTPWETWETPDDELISSRFDVIQGALKENG